MQDDPLMSIGTFSRASLLSVKALRKYHEQGLLVPAQVDGDTGYRSYQLSQLTDAAVIKRLRDLDLPLRQVHRIVSARDPEVTRTVIEAHQAGMQARLAELTKIVTDLQEAVELPALQTPIHIRHEAPVDALTISGYVDNGNYEPFMDASFGAIYSAIERCGLTIAGPGSALYDSHAHGEHEPVVVYLPVVPGALDEVAVAGGLALTTVPGATVAVTTHIGGYDTVGDAYRQLGAWVVRNATSAQAQVREHYIVSIDPASGQMFPDAQLRTEIAWPILVSKINTTTN